MFTWLLRFLLAKIAAVPIRRRLRQFEEATHRPEETQDAILRRILAHHAHTDFGRKHGFAGIRTLADYRRQLPIASYDYFEPYIQRVMKGETNALLGDPKVHMFALTSGTTAARKYIPVTDPYLRDYKRGWNLWGLRVFRDHRGSRFRPILQMSGDWQETFTEAGIPCGSVTGLTAEMQLRFIRKLYCVPACVGRVKDPAAKYYVALRLGLPRKVALVVAANPSTLVSMARAGDAEKESLIRDIHDGTLSTRFDIPAAVRNELMPKIAKKHPERAQELEAIVRRTGTLYPKDYWNQDCVIGNWMGGSVGAYLRHFPQYYGDTPVRDVGLIASEGRMTIPVADGTPSGILDVTTHFFEFIPEDEIQSPQPTVLSPHELVPGRNYCILPTTSYGLYRYNIFDVVRCTGFYHRTPLVEFLSKGSLFSNLTGEKISEYHVSAAMTETLRECNASLTCFSLAPCWDDVQPYYGLFVERGDLGDREQTMRLARTFETKLAEANIEYAAKRESQRLGPIRICVLPTGTWTEWDRQRLARTGGTLEQYKHPSLISDAKFRESVAVEEEIA
ncbi:MAG: GH3 auxin-responsive promoter family protein [Gemmataceae bacterium]|nr:GH3 auxin-responsive promoter family protein [Gemmataceae bacterium]